MNEARYEELLNRALDDDASVEELNELSGDLRHQPDRLADLQFHLVAWELFSQECRPERGADAFMAAWQTRLAAESGPASFVSRTLAALATDKLPGVDEAPVCAGADSGWGGRLVRRIFSRWSVALTSSACLLLLLALFIRWLFPTTGQPVLVDINGAGLFLERAGRSVHASQGTKLQSGDTLRALAMVTASVGFGREDTRIIFGPDTELRVLSISRGKRFALERGKLDASVARQRPFQPMIVRTPQAEARVLGTRFTLSVTNNATRLEVHQGKVRFTRISDGVSVPVPAGNYAVAASNYELLVQPLTGAILREYWTNLQSDVHMTLMLGNPQFPDHPNGRDYLDKLEGPNRWGENYGARIYGYLHPPETGEYTFWIEVGGVGELWVSWDDKPENRQQIGFSSEEPRERAQPSSPILLAAGRKYYIEARYKQGTKDKDFLIVSWQGPDRTREIIPGKFLSPFVPQPKKP